MRQYLDLMAEILEAGDDRPDRTGTGIRGLFGRQMRFDLRVGFPLLTTKKVHTKSIIHELIWFLRGDTNIAYLKENGVSIWDEWADEQGELGPVYGRQWRAFPTPDGKPVDQIARLLELIKTDPHSRRLVVSAWNPAEIESMALPPCHCLVQFYVNKGHLSCHLYQRSADFFLGVPFNIASYALLTEMIAHVSGLKAGDFVHSFGDVHLYQNHFEQARLQLDRTPTALPHLQLNPEVKDLFAFRYEDIKVLDYQAQSHIAAPVAV